MKSVIILAMFAFFALNAAYRFGDDNQPAYQLKIGLQSLHDNLFRFANYSAVPDTLFVQTELENLYYEMKLSKLAIDKSTNEAIKKLSRQILDDNGAVAQQLATLIGYNKVFSDEDSSAEDANDGETDSSEDPTLQRPSHTDYGMLSGIDFDRQWISDMQLSGRDRLTKNKAERMKTNDTRLQSILAGAIQNIQQHLNQLQTIRLQMM